MANKEHLSILGEGLIKWNRWREENPTAVPDLSEAELSGYSFFSVRGQIWIDFHNTILRQADLSGSLLRKADFRYSDLRNANLSNASLYGALFDHAQLQNAQMKNVRANGSSFYHANLSNVDLSGAELTNINASQAILSRANLSKVNASGSNFFETDLGAAKLIDADLRQCVFSLANLGSANFTRADLSGAEIMHAILQGAILSSARLHKANLSETYITWADLSGAQMRQVDLSAASLLETNLSDADLTDSIVYGTSVWDVQMERTIQKNLLITKHGSPNPITVDNLEIAQFIYILLRSKKIRQIVDAITAKVVLILGRFTGERKAVLDAIREALRARDYLPVLFDFEKPASRDLTETISTLAHMARFVIADITDARSIPQELGRIIPNLPSVPVQPLLKTDEYEYGMFEHLKRYPWVLSLYKYKDISQVITELDEKIIAPLEAIVKKMYQAFRDGNKVVK
jgi:uncharacterized protein YjbI with pentapeptide repeats